jgi:hypothetical protein
VKAGSPALPDPSLGKRTNGTILSDEWLDIHERQRIHSGFS